jgi:predicted Rdx family selenoprotein
LQAAIKAKYGTTAALKEGSGGIFFVDIDGKRVWDNQVTYRFPEDTEVFAEIDKLKT